jgi:N-acetylmuramic acid 6-phosphate etherase
MVDLQATNAKLRHRAARLVERAARVDESTAARALTSTNGEVKTAIVVLRLGVSVDEARTRLAATDGRLRVVLEES